MVLGLRQFVFSVAGVLAATLCSGALAVTQIGFALDRSGSVALSDFDLQADGLSAALAAVPTDGSVEVTVVSYASSVTTVIAPTIVTAANLPGIVATVAAQSGGSGGTRTDLAIDSLTSLMTGSPVFSAPDTTSLINISTDGAPNSQSLTEAAGVNANAAGIDSISFEAIGSGVSSTSALNNMVAVAFPGTAQILAVNSTNIPNPVATGTSFVVPVSDFSAYAQVIDAKVQAAVAPPPPNGVPVVGSLSLMLLGFVALGVGATSRREMA